MFLCSWERTFLINTSEFSHYSLKKKIIIKHSRQDNEQAINTDDSSASWMIVYAERFSFVSVVRQEHVVRASVTWGQGQEVLTGHFC